jgi:hypothetical protein
LISAFGPQAIRYARGLGDLDAVIAEVGNLGQGYVEAVKRLESGRPFYCMLLLDDPRVAFGNAYGEQILSQIPDYDRRRIVLEQLALGALPVNGPRVDTVWHFDPVMQGMASEFLGLGDAVLVRSYGEIPRLQRWCANTIPPRSMYRTVRILAEASVPIVERIRPEHPAVVVWAPHRPASDCALALHGLLEFHGDVICVSSGAPFPTHARATFLEPGGPAVAAALSRAPAIVCVDPADPSEAVAFARRGYGVVAPLTSGAYEFAPEIVTWDAIDARRLFTAVAVAVTRPAAVRAEPPHPPRAPSRAIRPAFIKPDELPLVSIVTPTYNRPDDLRKMLSCLAAQTYPNIESVVVNDGGVCVDDIVADFPFARVIDLPENAGALRAVEVGRRAARGEYIGLLPDDDWLYPHHIEQMMNAMFRSGAKIAHGSALLRYLERDETGVWQTAAFNNRTFSQTLAPTEALVTSTLGGHQMLVHRSVYETAGGYLLDSEVSDNEIHIRFTQRYFYAFVDRVTAEFRDHSGGQGRQCDFPAALHEIYENVHPLPNRPAIRHVRQATIQHISTREPGQPPFPATIRVLKPSPPS